MSSACALLGSRRESDVSTHGTLCMGWGQHLETPMFSAGWTFLTR